MNKKQLIARVRLLMGPGATRSTATASVDAVLDSLAELAEEGPLHLAHFGTFEVKERAATKGYDIASASMRPRAACRYLSFRPSESLAALAALCPLPRPRGGSEGAQGEV